MKGIVSCVADRRRTHDVFVMCQLYRCSQLFSLCLAFAALKFSSLVQITYYRCYVGIKLVIIIIIIIIIIRIFKVG